MLSKRVARSSWRRRFGTFADLDPFCFCHLLWHVRFVSFFVSFGSRHVTLARIVTEVVGYIVAVIAIFVIIITIVVVITILAIAIAIAIVIAIVIASLVAYLVFVGN